MSQARLLAPKSWDRAFYHCVSRVVNRSFIFGDEEHAEFLHLMRMYEKFCQVKVMTYCLMSNHFHLLVEVPARPPEGMSEPALMEHIRSCFGDAYANKVEFELTQLRLSGDEAGAKHMIDGYLNRMWDLSAFMKSLKQRFTQWYNFRNDRVGTLWECRFKSVIIQSGHALLTVATYIDLNPVRAKLVSDPKDYRWCGYAAALGGVKLAFQGIHRIVSRALEWSHVDDNIRQSLEEYRVLLFITGEAPNRDTIGSSEDSRRTRRHGISSANVAEVEKKQGKLSAAQMLRCRVRYFVDGAAIGSRSFVEEVFASCRERIHSKRKVGASRMKGADFGGLCSLRDLKVRVIIPS